MATVNGFTAERMLQIENTTVVDGEVDGDGHLVLMTREGTPIDAGVVSGDVGPVAGLIPFQANGTLTVRTYPTVQYVSQAGNYRVRANVRERGTGADLIVNVYVDGVPLFSGGDRPTITAGSGVGSDQADIPVALTVGQFITAIEVVQVGSSWSTLVVQLIKEFS